MSEGEAAMMLRSVCSALQAAHAKGIVHRDLKPDNIFLVPDTDSATGERTKVLDFGIAKLTDVGLAGSTTKTGAVMGTPTYMSPEQCRGTGNVDHRADIYSLGCIFFELMCGRPPFVSLGAGELLGAHLYVEPDRPTKYNKELSPETERLIMTMLDKNPERRPQSCRELGQRLTQLSTTLGWITSTSPNGITAESLRELPTVVKPPGAPIDFSEWDGIRTTEPPAATTPYGLEKEAVPVDKPTTLSGAASQSMLEVPPSRRRKRLAIALGAVALAMVVVVIVIKASGDKGETRAAAAQPPLSESVEKSAVEGAKAADTKAAEDKAAADRKAAEDKAAADKLAADKLAADKLAEKKASDKLAAEKAAAEKAAAEKKAAADRKAAAEKKAAADKAAADKLAAERRNAGQRGGQTNTTTTTTAGGGTPATGTGTPGPGSAEPKKEEPKKPVLFEPTL
jgi:serine/threonine-protein kinase